MAAHVVILAGGTGGHVFPALAVARELAGSGHTVTWIGTRKGLEARVVPAAGLPIVYVRAEGVRGRGLAQRVVALARLMGALLQSVIFLRRLRPQVVLGMGGFASVPGGLAAWLLGIPLVIHEQNRVPGTSNRLLTRLARRVLEGFTGSFPARVGAIATGNPLRAELAALPEHTPRRADAPLRVLVLGGSQGASALNAIVPDGLALLDAPCAVRHQSGEAQREETSRRYESLSVVAEVVPFIADMAEAYLWADVAICRAGAMTVSELCAAGLPALLIPFPHAIDDHQSANARVLSDAGAARLVAQVELEPAVIAGWLNALQGDRTQLSAMGSAARGLARRDAARAVAGICLEEALP